MNTSKRQMRMPGSSGRGAAGCATHSYEVFTFDHGRATQVGLTNGSPRSELLAALTEIARNAVRRTSWIS